MNFYRRLQFERMESRVALSADLQALIEKAVALETRPGENREALHHLLDEYRSLNAPATTSSDQSKSSISDAGNSNSPTGQDDSPSVEFRVSVHDTNGNGISSYETEKTYFARVYVRDVRVLGSDDDQSGGVFQSVVDLNFGDNALPTGPVNFAEQFSALQRPGERSASSILGAGAVSDSLFSTGQAEQFFLEAPFMINSPYAPTSISVAPSASSDEPVLLYGANTPVPLANVSPGVFEIPTIDGETTPPINDPAANPVPDGEFPPNLSPTPARPVFDGPTQTDSDRLLVSFLPRFDPPGHMDIGFSWSLFEIEVEDDDEQIIDLLWPPQPGLPGPPDAISSDAELNNEPEDENDEEQMGLFYDERIFIEGLLIDPLQSRFRLRFQRFSFDEFPQAGSGDSSPFPESRTLSERAMVDIADILRPRIPTKAWTETIDSIASETPATVPSPVANVARDMGMTFETGSNEIAEKSGSHNHKRSQRAAMDLNE